MFTSLSEFTLLPTILGNGSFGSVKLAFHPNTNQYYALKIINIKLLLPQDLLSVRREIAVHSSISHPNIVKFYGNFQENSQIILVLEYMSSGNLYQYIKSNGKISDIQVFQFFYSTIMGLQYLHKSNILHRDLKPENLLLDSNLQLKLSDFGWCAVDLNRKRSTLCGTYEYMSPEVAFQKPYSSNADIWALGVLLYEIMNGKSPFQAKTLPEIKNRLKSQRKILFNENIEPDAKDLIEKLLERDGDRRIKLNEILKHKWIRKMKEKIFNLEKNQKLNIKILNFNVQRNVAKSEGPKDLIKTKKRSLSANKLDKKLNYGIKIRTEEDKKKCSFPINYLPKPKIVSFTVSKGMRVKTAENSDIFQISTKYM